MPLRKPKIDPVELYVQAMQKASSRLDGAGSRLDAQIEETLLGLPIAIYDSQIRVLPIEPSCYEGAPHWQVGEYMTLGIWNENYEERIAQLEGSLPIMEAQLQSMEYMLDGSREMYSKLGETNPADLQGNPTAEELHNFSMILAKGEVQRYEEAVERLKEIYEGATYLVANMPGLFKLMYNCTSMESEAFPGREDTARRLSMAYIGRTDLKIIALSSLQGQKRLWSVLEELDPEFHRQYKINKKDWMEIDSCNPKKLAQVLHATAQYQRSKAQYEETFNQP